MARSASLVLALALAALVAPGGCHHTPSGPGAVTLRGDVVSSDGTVIWSPLEGGFYAIRGSDGTTYDPINLPAAFRQNGLRVRFQGRIRDDLAGIHMVGPILELDSIETR